MPDFQLSKRFRHALAALLLMFLGAQASRAAPILADSVTEFSGVQGQNNWYYGYYATPGASSSFTQMAYFDAVGGTVGGSGGPWWEETTTQGAGATWTLLWATGGHPGGPLISPLHWAVRRWVSEVSGSITISGTLQDADGGGGNGVFGRILVDGVEVYTGRVDAISGPATLAYSIDTVVSVGSVVDFAIDPNGNELYDSTIFTAKIAGVPEPSTLLLLGSALVALAGARRDSLA